MHPCVFEATAMYVHERVTEWASLAVWCILLGLNQCHISPCRSVSQGKSWAKGWQSLALMDKVANNILSTNLSSATHNPESSRLYQHCSHSVTHKIYVCLCFSLPLRHAHMLLQWRRCRGIPPLPNHCVCACVSLCCVQDRAFISLCWYSTALYPVCQEQQRDNDILYRRL